MTTSSDETRESDLISRPINLDALIHFLDDGKYQALAADMRAPFNRLATVWKRA